MFVGADDPVRPAKCTAETRKSSANSYCQRADRGVRPYRGLKVSEVCVGDDAYIVPAESSVLIENSGEFDGTQWVDVGIDPYAPI